MAVSPQPEGGKLTVTTLGTYPDLPLLEARQQALELATKRKSYSPTVDVAAEQWLSERIDHTHRKAELIRGYVERAVVPALGNRRVRDIEPSEIASVIRDYRDRTAKKAAARKGGRTAARALLGVYRRGIRCRVGRRLCVQRRHLFDRHGSSAMHYVMGRPGFRQSFAVAEQAQTEYCIRQGASCDQPAGKVNIDTAYVAVNAPVIREQLQRAGVRLAHLLDAALGR